MDPSYSVDRLGAVAPSERSRWLDLALVTALVAYAVASGVILGTRGLDALLTSTNPYASLLLAGALVLNRAGWRKAAAYTLVGTIGAELAFTFYASQYGVRSASAMAVVPWITGVALLFGTRAGIVAASVAGVLVPILVTTSPVGPGLPAQDLTVYAVLVFSGIACLVLIAAFRRSLRRVFAMKGEAEARTRELVDESPDALLWFDPSGRLDGLNGAARRLLSLPRSSSLGEAFGGLPLTTVDGESPNWPLPERTPVILKVRGADRYLEALSRIVTRSDGSRGALVALREATARVQAERHAQDLRAQLESARKMAAISRLAGGVAHDFNNLLGALIGQAEMLEDATPEEVAAISREQIETLERGAALTRRLSAFTNWAPINPEAVNVADVVRSLEPSLRAEGPDGVRLDVDLVSAGAVRIDRERLEQVVRDLVANAFDAVAEGGSVRVVVTATEEAVTLEVRDDGAGMTDEVRLKAFEPFFTTKARRRGTGLGLAVVHGFVAASGGRVELESRPDRGTTVRVVWPLSVSSDSLPVGIDERAGPISARVLVVDDLPDTLMSVARLLQRSRLDVDLATSGEDALDRVRSAHEAGPPFDLLVTDIVMPGMSGIELGARARAIDPRLRVIYMTGFGDEVVDQADELATADLLMKPFGSAELIRRVRKKLGDRARVEPTPPIGTRA